MACRNELILPPGSVVSRAPLRSLEICVESLFPLLLKLESLDFPSVTNLHFKWLSFCIQSQDGVIM